MLMPSIFGENLFDDFFDDFARPYKVTTGYTQPANIMKTDVKETEGSFELDIDMPGYKKEDVKAELKDGYLTITGTTKKETGDQDKKGKYVRRERYCGSCSRSFSSFFGTLIFKTPSSNFALMSSFSTALPT